MSLADELSLPGTTFVFPAAPLLFSALYGAPTWVDARAWWPLDLERIERMRRSGGERDLSQEVPEGLPSAREAVIGLLDALEARFPGVPVILGGFSQGAMLACDVVLHTSRPFAGLVLLSGALLCAPDWTPRMPARVSLPVFQSHGTEDDILPYSSAEALRELFRASGVNVQFTTFRGGHGIVSEVLSALRTFLANLEIPSNA